MSEFILTNAPDTGFIASDYLTKRQNRFNQKKPKVSHYPSALNSVSSSSNGLSRITTAFISADLESKQVIQEYFKSSPERRKDLRQLVAYSVKSTNSVLEVLESSIKTDVRDAYNAAVDLLAKSSDVTLEVARYPMLEHLISEKKVATLISGIARASHIPVTERLKVVLQNVQTGKRMIKESVVESLFLLADEAIENSLNSNILPIVKFYLSWFASDKQPDKFIQRYARDIIDELP
jgi:hypothetical protein